MLGLRPAKAQHMPNEAIALAKYAAGCRSIVEIGVAEGVSAAVLRRAAHAEGHLWLIDPMVSRFPVSPMSIVAKRSVRRSGGSAKVTWVRKFSDEAVTDWSHEIDFLFIDADHSYEACERDWLNWSPFVKVGGRVAFHDSWLPPESLETAPWGPVRVVDYYFRNPTTRWAGWRVLDRVGTLTVVERAD